MKKVGILVVVSMLILGMFIFADNVKYGGVVNLGGSAPTYMAANFNPFLLFSGAADPGTVFVYEPLMYVNPLNGAVTPLLGTAYQWKDNNLKMVVTIRKGVKWNDGVPFTPEDVVFTFNLIKKYPALDANGIWSDISGLQSVEASGDDVVFTFSKPDTPMDYYILRNTRIVPEHVWSTVEDPTTYINADNPVGTGPFLRTNYSVSNNTEYFSKNPNYWWQGRPYIDGIRMIGNVSNEAAFLQMLKGETDENDIAIADPMRTWINKDPQNNLMFWPTYSSNILLMNDAKTPFNNATFRKALSLAIDKKLLEDRAYWGTGGYDISQTQIIPAQRSEWYDTNLASEDAYLNSYNPTEAQKLLESVGYKKNSAGVLVGPDGKTLPTFNILVGTGWTDFITMAQNISQELKSIGINTTIVQQSYSTYMTLLMTGNFDMVILNGTPQIGPNPFNAYYSEFYPGFSAPLGQSAISDYSRYTNSDITKALNDFMASSDPSVQRQAMYTIEKVLLDDLPMIVLTNRTGFDLYSQKTFVGWPTIENPYSNGWNTDGIDMELVVLNIHLK
ncbi:MAG: ABC transporter substrate-binding protein [Athalassotoga sp.]|uniref:ABC transporter substrate-binding protein n=1 Tax=Athalassotoga sp. TaxID=2022597 RepID=UPI003CFFF689